MKLLNSLDQVSKFMSVGKKMTDSIPIGFLGGLMGTIAMDLSNLFFKKAGISEKTYAQYAGSVLMSPFRLMMKENRMLGQLLHLITGSIMGIPLCAVLKKAGKDNYIFKGAIFGTVTWELLYSFGLRYGVFRTKAHSTRTHFTTLIDNLVYGSVSTITMVWLADRSVFPEGREKQAEIDIENEISRQTEALMREPMYNDEKQTTIH